MVGASRERVNKAIALFVKLGWLEISGRSRYRIVNREELEIRATDLVAAPERLAALAERDRRAHCREPLAYARRCSRRGGPGVAAAPTHARALAHASRRRRARWTSRSGSCTKPCSAPSTTTISQSVASAPRRAQRVDVGRRASTGRRSRRTRASAPSRAATSSGSMRWPGPLPRLGRADHPVERDRGVEAIDRRRLEHVVPAHAEAEHRDPRHVVFDDEEVGGRVEHVQLLGVVEILDVREPRSRPTSARRLRLAARTARSRSTASPCVARRRAMSSNSGRRPPMSGCSTSPRSACRRAGRGPPATSSPSTRADAPRP